jgi:hypothetical protein
MNSIPFVGQVAGKGLLAAGNYVAVITARNAGGRSGAAALSFTIRS